MNTPRTGALVDGYMTGLVVASADLPSAVDVAIARKLREVELEFRQREKRRRELARRLRHWTEGSCHLRHGILMLDKV